MGLFLLPYSWSSSNFKFVTSASAQFEHELQIICEFVCKCECLCVCACVFVLGSVSVLVCVYLCACVFVCEWLYILVSVWVFVCACLLVCVYLCLRVWVSASLNVKFYYRNCFIDFLINLWRAINKTQRLLLVEVKNPFNFFIATKHATWMSVRIEFEWKKTTNNNRSNALGIIAFWGSS